MSYTVQSPVDWCIKRRISRDHLCSLTNKIFLFFFLCVLKILKHSLMPWRHNGAQMLSRPGLKVAALGASGGSCTWIGPQFDFNCRLLKCWFLTGSKTCLTCYSLPILVSQGYFMWKGSKQLLRHPYKKRAQNLGIFKNDAYLINIGILFLMLHLTTSQYYASYCSWIWVKMGEWVNATI